MHLILIVDAIPLVAFMCLVEWLMNGFGNGDGGSIQKMPEWVISALFLFSEKLSVFYIYLSIYHLSLYHLSVYTSSDLWSFPGWAVVKNPPVNAGDQEMRFYPWVRKIPWRRAWQPTPVFLPGKPHGQRSLVGYSPWGCKELDMTEWLSTQIPSGLRK